MTPMLPDLPARAPRNSAGSFSRWLGRAALRLGGWKMVGQWPNVDRMVVIVAPHSSAWDVVWGIAAVMGLGLGVVFMGKKEAFHGPLGWLLRRYGGIPVDRASPGGIVEQVASQMRNCPQMWFVLAPEGTRRKVDKWKSGFWKIARRAQVPVFCVGFDYVERSIRLGELVELSNDMEADMQRLRALFTRYRGRNHDV